MANLLVSDTGYPPSLVSGYVVDELKKFGILTGVEQMMPIFPTSPVNIDEVYSNYLGAPGVQDPLLIQYERLLRFRPSTMYRHKREQLVYYLYSTNLSKILDSNRVISEALDREDISAQEVNQWAMENPLTNDQGNTIKPNVFFHSMRVYQADETRDLLDLASARTLYTNKLIIEYDYHTTTKGLYD